MVEARDTYTLTEEFPLSSLWWCLQKLDTDRKKASAFFVVVANVVGKKSSRQMITFSAHCIAP